jgi:hypothetical protein
MAASDELLPWMMRRISQGENESGEDGAEHDPESRRRPVVDPPIPLDQLLDSQAVAPCLEGGRTDLPCLLQRLAIVAARRLFDHEVELGLLRPYAMTPGG